MKGLQAPELGVLVSASARSPVETSFLTCVQVSSLVNRGSVLGLHVLMNTRASFVPCLDPIVPFIWSKSLHLSMVATFRLPR